MSCESLANQSPRRRSWYRTASGTLLPSPHPEVGLPTRSSSPLPRHFDGRLLDLKQPQEPIGPPSAAMHHRRLPRLGDWGATHPPLGRRLRPGLAPRPLGAALAAAPRATGPAWQAGHPLPVLKEASTKGRPCPRASASDHGYSYDDGLQELHGRPVVNGRCTPVTSPAQDSLDGMPCPHANQLSES